MNRAGQLTRSLLRGAALAGAGSALLAAGAAASGASLKIEVPAKIRPGQKYVIKVLGSYDTSHVRGPAYLWAAIQYSSAACRSTAQAESRLPHSIVYRYYDNKEPGSPFIKTDHWKAGTFTGLRHVCAYLYPGPFSPRSHVRPLARADARYRDV